MPNLKGAQRAIETGADLLLVPLSASHAHSLANLRKTPDEVVAEVAKIRAARDAAGSKTLIEGGVGTAFGCTLQGRVEPSEVLRLMQALLDAGADRVSIADTVGYADPRMVRDLFEHAVSIAGDRFWCGHFHDTRGLAMANVYAALEVGVARFDASLAGIGGCPHAPGASGNASTEDLAYMLASMGIETGIDIAKLLALREKVADWLAGETLHGTLWRAGLPKTFDCRASRRNENGMDTSTKEIAAAGRRARHRIHAHGHGTDVRHDPRRPGRRGHQDRAAGRRQDAQAAGPRHRLLPLVQPQQEERRARHQHPEGHATALELIAQSDVVLENFRPGLMATLGLDYDTLSKKFPRLIYVSHKGFLPGPYENRLALDEVVQMMGGLSYMTGPKGRPLRAGTSVNDIMGGMFGAIGVLAALRERDRTGKGQEIQSALFENCVFLSAQHMQQYAMTGEAPPPMPSRVSAWSVYDVFELADGEQLFIGAVSDKQFKTLCDVLERPDLATDPALQTNAQRVAVRPDASAAPGRDPQASQEATSCPPSSKRPAIPYAPIVRPEQLLDDPHLQGERRPRADADRRRQRDRRRAAAAVARRPASRRAPAAAAHRRAHRRSCRLIRPLEAPLRKSGRLTRMTPRTRNQGGFMSFVQSSAAVRVRRQPRSAHFRVAQVVHASEQAAARPSFRSAPAPASTRSCAASSPSLTKALKASRW